jgi:YbbR domain-containing protein
MMSILRGFVKSIPTLILSFALAVAVWISAVNAADPIRQQPLARAIPVELTGLDPALVVSGDVPDQVSVTISAPKSILDSMSNERAPVHAGIDLSGLGPGTYTLPVKVQPQPQIRPAKIVSQSPPNATITLEKLVSEEFSVHLVLRGDPAIGFQADAPTVSPDKVLVSGPASQVSRVKEARVALDLTQASDNINRVVDVQVLDANDAPVNGVICTPKQVKVTQPISQRGGYRNVVVKVAYTGQVASGYRLTNVSVFPPLITVFSSNPQLVERLPGYVETSPLDLTGVKDDIDKPLPLNLPNGVEVVGDQTVLVQVGVAAIEGSVTLSGLPVQVTGLAEDLSARLSPEAVDVIISGPVPLLDRLAEGDMRVVVDLSGVGEGTYQFAPKVVLPIPELRVESILPSSIEVVVEPKRSGTLTPVPQPTLTPTPRR